MIRWLVLAVAGLMAFAPQAPTRDAGSVQATGTGTLGGVVVADEPGNRPLRRTVVTLNGADVSVARTTITDDAGRFEFGGLPAGRFNVVATKAGYVTTYFGGRRPGRPPAVPIPLAQGQALRTVVVKMLAGAVITGRVFDPHGLPPPLASVNVMEVRGAGAERVALTRPALARWDTFVDERGMYRVYGLPPGDFVVVASPLRYGSATGDVRATGAADLQRALVAIGEARAGIPGAAAVPAAPAAPPPMLGFAEIYYPGTSEFGAAAIVTVGPGETRADVDFPLPMVPLSTVSGVVVGADGKPAGNTMVTLSTPGPQGGSSAGTQANAQTGVFSVRSLVPGQYSLIARSTPVAVSGMPTPVPLWASMDLTIDGRDVRDLAITLQPGSTIGGRVVFEGTAGATPPEMSRVRIGLGAGVQVSGRASMGTGVSAAQPDGSGLFVFNSVPPGRHRLTASILGAGSMPAWVLKSAQAGGRDAADLPVDVQVGETMGNVVVTFTDLVTELTGVIRDAAGATTSDHVLVVFSTDRRYWLSGSRRVAGPIRPDADGRYVVRGLPAGEYFLGVAMDIDAAELRDGSIFASLAAQAVRITLGEGERKRQDLRVGG